MEYRNAQYTENGSIDCEINHPKHGWIPFTASPDDDEKHGRDLFETIKKDGNIAEYVAPVATDEQKWEEIRQQRNQLIAATDYAVLPDSPHDTQAMRDYRQALRDITNAKSPNKVKWPKNPLEK